MNMRVLPSFKVKRKRKLDFCSYIGCLILGGSLNSNGDAADRQPCGVGKDLMDVWRQALAALLQVHPRLFKRSSLHQEWLAQALERRVLEPVRSLPRELADPTVGRLVSLGRGRLRSNWLPCSLL